VAAFPVADDDQVMLVTNKGTVIRIPVDGIRIAGRNTQGVPLFNIDEDEHVVSVARLEGAAEANGGDGAVVLDDAGDAAEADGDGSENL
jgi:DNA gyrase subunit A